MDAPGSLAEQVVIAIPNRMGARPATPAFAFRSPRTEVLVLLLGLWFGVVHAETLQGRVSKVVDGSTITILSATVAHRVRLSAIEAPEIRQPFGEASRKSLAEMVAGREVEVEIRATDRYGRKVGVVTVDGHDVGLLQIERGLAWHAGAHEREQTAVDRAHYAAAENDAREAKRGLWRDPKPLPPQNAERGP